MQVSKGDKIRLSQPVSIRTYLPYGKFEDNSRFSPGDIIEVLTSEPGTFHDSEKYVYVECRGQTYSNVLVSSIAGTKV